MWSFWQFMKSCTFNNNYSICTKRKNWKTIKWLHSPRLVWACNEGYIWFGRFNKLQRNFMIQVSFSISAIIHVRVGIRITALRFLIQNHIHRGSTNLMHKPSLIPNNFLLLKYGIKKLYTRQFWNIEPGPKCDLKRPFSDLIRIRYLFISLWSAECLNKELNCFRCTLRG
jgi:hypothetical protein